MYHFSRQYLIIRVVLYNQVKSNLIESFDKSNLIESLISKVNALTLTCQKSKLFTWGGIKTDIYMLRFLK